MFACVSVYPYLTPCSLRDPTRELLEQSTFAKGRAIPLHAEQEDSVAFALHYLLALHHKVVFF